jgi:hypothetical protein
VDASCELKNDYVLTNANDLCPDGLPPIKEVMGGQHAAAWYLVRAKWLATSLGMPTIGPDSKILRVRGLSDLPEIAVFGNESAILCRLSNLATSSTLL